MKKILAFTLTGSEYVSVNSTQSFNEDSGVELDVVFFTTAFNRNKAYFQVSDLLKSKNKLTKLLTNINHDLKITGGKYFGNTTKHTFLDSRVNDGVFEVFGKIVSSDPYVIEHKDEITGVSIEILYDEKDVIENENGLYITDYEWYATAILMGVPAGSGDTRIENIKTFSADGKLTELSQEDLNNSKMNPEEIKQVVLEAVNEAVSSLKDEVQALKATVETLKPETIKNEVEEDFTNEPTPEDKQSEAEVKQVDEAKAEFTKKQADFSGEKDEELVVDPAKDAMKPAATFNRKETIGKLM